MNGARLEFARALELVCRRINPPHRAYPASIDLADLALEDTQFNVEDNAFAYRYLRGLDIRDSGTGPYPIWAFERGLTSIPTAIAEVGAGVLAIGDANGLNRIFERAARGEWECVATLHSHRGIVWEIVPLDGGGFASAGGDGYVAIHRRDPFGMWELTFPTIAYQPQTPVNGMGVHHAMEWRMGNESGLGLNVAPNALYTICQLDDGSLISAGQSGVFVELKKLPSGDWEGSISTFATPGAPDITRVTAHSQNGYCVIQAQRVPMIMFRRPGKGQDGKSLPFMAGGLTDIQRWGQDLIASSESGEIVLLTFGSEAQTETISALPVKVSSTPLRMIRVIDDGHVATWGDDRKVRVWQRREDRFALCGAVESPQMVKPCFSPLCDGRVAFSDMRGVSIASPQLDETWRVEDVVSTIHPTVTGIAPLETGRVAYTDGIRLRVLQFAERGVVAVSEIRTEGGSISSLVAIDASTLAVGFADGRLQIARQSGTEWALENLRLTSAGAVTCLSGSADFMASGHASGAVMTWRRQDGRFEILKAYPASPNVSAIAVNGRSEVAVAWEDRPLAMLLGEKTNLVEAPGPGITGCVGLEWQDDEQLLILERTGKVSRRRFSPLQTEVVYTYSELSGKPAMTCIPRGAGPPLIAHSRGCSPIVLDAKPRFMAVHSEIRVLAAATDYLFAGGDALYLFDLRSDWPEIRRILVTDDVIVDAQVDIRGRTGAARIHRRGVDNVWNFAISGGHSVPSDALLSRYVAVIGYDGHLAPPALTETSMFTETRRIFEIEDPTVSC